MELISMDIQKLWDIQSKFFDQVKGMNENMTNEEFCHSLCLHLHAEVSELLEAIGGPWKTHLRKSTEMRKSQVLSEVVDITKLAWEIAIAFGIDSYEFEEKFRLKSRVVKNRLSSEQFLMENQSPVVVMDFDGVMKEVPCFYFTRPKMEEETGISEYQQNTAEKLLIQKGIIKKRDCGMPKRNYYYIDEQALERFLREETEV